MYKTDCSVLFPLSTIDNVKYIGGVYFHFLFSILCFQFSCFLFSVSYFLFSKIGIENLFAITYFQNLFSLTKFYIHIFISYMYINYTKHFASSPI